MKLIPTDRLTEPVAEVAGVKAEEVAVAGPDLVSASEPVQASGRAVVREAASALALPRIAPPYSFGPRSSQRRFVARRGSRRRTARLLRFHFRSGPTGS